jgi:hypothetical protein
VVHRNVSHGAGILSDEGTLLQLPNGEADIPNYTDIAPIIQISEVVVG